MTPEQWANKLEGKLQKILTGPAFEIAGKDAFSVQSRRLFIDGQKSDGSPLGSYSTTPLYVSDRNLPTSGNHKGKTGKTTKSSYYAGGYAELRAQQGRESGFVNLRFSNELQADYLNSNVSPSSGSVGEVNPTVVTPLILNLNLKKSINIVKLGQLTAKYGVFVNFTKKEVQTLVDSYVFQLNSILNA